MRKAGEASPVDARDRRPVKLLPGLGLELHEAGARSLSAPRQPLRVLARPLECRLGGEEASFQCAEEVLSGVYFVINASGNFAAPLAIER